MELRAFIAKALEDIVLGVKDAQAKTPSGVVVPAWPSTLETVKAGLSDQTVEFEVTVKTDETKGSEAKLSVVAAVVAGGIKGQSGSASGYAAKLSFRVPVRFEAKLG
jgi:hypothetical protein